MTFWIHEFRYEQSVARSRTRMWLHERVRCRVLARDGKHVMVAADALFVNRYGLLMQMHITV